MCAITYYIFVTSVKNKKYPNTIWQLSTANWRSVEESGKTSPMKVWMVKGNVIMPTEKEAKRHWRQQALLRWEDKRRYKEWLSLKRTFNPIFLTQCLPNFLISIKKIQKQRSLPSYASFYQKNSSKKRQMNSQDNTKLFQNNSAKLPEAFVYTRATG